MNRLKKRSHPKEITVTIQQEDGWYCGHWNDPSGKGGISTQGRDLYEIIFMVEDAVKCHFDVEELPVNVKLHFIKDPILVEA